MDLQLKGKRAVISGGSKGIGLSAARALAAEGVDLVLAARDAEVLAAAAQAITAEYGVKAIPVPTDVRDDAAVRALAQRAEDELGGADILVNSASNQQVGAGHPGLAGTTDENFYSDIDVKLVGYLRTARAISPLMIRQGWGRIINISGLGARSTLSITRTIRNVSVVALTKNLADELGPHGINVTGVHPGQTRTEPTDHQLAQEAARLGVSFEDAERRRAANILGRLVHADEIADVIAFLASPRSVSITGDFIPVGGGQPGVVYY
ncbi:short-chain dehydrogenase [Azorhizobium oxalatiphilum]|uniref:Short-chain dehydrogenase n=1 Tax=Azorhizobium oxalatiphilum TaxID=980631 RepID=A0A917F8R7_9HYPH|nr:SDR family oxidoreductase [Azorhizobium oxalatiphilum]GGF58350.1 short-chain dehydrogenase [Azorhizobium oxalatiphilum]